MDKNSEKPIRILIAEDHEIVRCGLKGILEQQHDFEVVGETPSYKEMLVLISTHNPNVILLDLTLDDGDSLDCISKIIACYPNCKVLIYTASLDKETHINAMHQGAVGILLKSQKTELLCKAIRHVYNLNELWVDQALTAEMWKQATPPHPSATLSMHPSDTLTPRENQIACLSSRGLSAKQIGEKLSISEKTVRNQRTLIYSKLNFKNQLDLSINGNFVKSCENNTCQFRDNCPG